MAEIAGIDTQALRNYVDRVVALHQERKELNDAIAEVYDEAKESGLVTKHLRQIVREAMMEAEVREANYATLESYRRALGMLGGTPLGDYAMSHARDEAPARRGPGRPRKPQPVENGGHEIGEPVGAA